MLQPAASPLQELVGRNGPGRRKDVSDSEYAIWKLTVQMQAGHDGVRSQMSTVGSIRALLQVAGGDVEARREALRALASISAGGASSRSMIADSGGLHFLSEALAPDERIIDRLVAAELLLYLAGDGEKQRRRIVDAGVTKHIVSLGTYALSEAKVLAARLLGLLAADPGISSALIQEAGGVEVLLGMLEAGTVEEQLEAARSLGSIAADGPGMRGKMATLGVVQPLLQMLRADVSLQAKGWALYALLCLSCDCLDNKQEIARDVEPLVKLLRCGGPELYRRAACILALLADTNELGCRSSIAEFCNAPASPETRGNHMKDPKKDKGSPGIERVCNTLAARRIIDAEALCIGALVRTAERSEHSSCQPWAAFALGHLAYYNVGHRAKLSQAEGAVSALIALVAAGDAELVESGSYALCQLAAGNNAAKLAIIKANGIKPLVDTVRSPGSTSQAREHAASALGRLACVRDCSGAQRQAVREAGAIEPLVAVAAAGTQRERHWCTYALAQICAQGDTALIAVAACDGVKTLLSVAAGDNGKAKEWAACALLHLAAFRDKACKNQDLFSSHGAGIGSLSELVELTRRDPEASECAAAALKLLGTNSLKVQSKITKANGIPALLGAAKGGGGGRGSERAVEALASLSYRGEDAKEQFRSSGGLPQLFKLASASGHGSPQTKAAAATALGRATTAPCGRPAAAAPRLGKLVAASVVPQA
eukprot:TRINITY_DN104086_c0_g1_i1.p1 TRINITY_DN104086_c0_g1~~TRINITY_DN104086_c0_g1_i1.p1  ORF type:complete len:714 (-),score=108.20 TRINITY_DN104086_c0_g1_i1:312-2453(-)